MKEIKPHNVTLLITKRVSYVVDARTPEEAEVIAEQYLVDGEEPAESETLEVIPEEAFPVE